MPAKRNWTGWIEFIGVLAFFLSVMEPWKWSPIMMAGSGLIAWTAYLKNRRRKRSFLIGFMMITFGAAYLLLLSDMPGGNPFVQYHWLLLPAITYPLGWLFVVILLSMRVLKSHTAEVKPPVYRQTTIPFEAVSMGPSVVQAVSRKKIKKPKRIGNVQP